MSPREFSAKLRARLVFFPHSVAPARTNSRMMQDHVPPLSFFSSHLLLRQKASSQKLPGRPPVCRDHDVRAAVRRGQQLHPPALCGGVHVGGVPGPAPGGRA